MSDSPEPAAVYELVGGLPFFEALVDRFYQGVMADPVLAPNYPEDDLEGAKVRLTYFLVQYWGGPTTYSDHRGHPRLTRLIALSLILWLHSARGCTRHLAAPDPHRHV